jgi:hypothetical protein
VLCLVSLLWYAETVIQGIGVTMTPPPRRPHGIIIHTPLGHPPLHESVTPMILNQRYVR